LENGGFIQLTSRSSWWKFLLVVVLVIVLMVVLSMLMVLLSVEIVIMASLFTMVAPGALLVVIKNDAGDVVVG
jgi:hypothetical protein